MDKYVLGFCIGVGVMLIIDLGAGYDAYYRRGAVDATLGILDCHTIQDSRKISKWVCVENKPQ